MIIHKDDYKDDYKDDVAHNSKSGGASLPRSLTGFLEQKWLLVRAGFFILLWFSHFLLFCHLVRSGRNLSFLNIPNWHLDVRHLHQVVHLGRGGKQAGGHVPARGGCLD